MLAQCTGLEYQKDYALMPWCPGMLEVEKDERILQRLVKVDKEDGLRKRYSSSTPSLANVSKLLTLSPSMLTLLTNLAGAKLGSALAWLSLSGI